MRRLVWCQAGCRKRQKTAGGGICYFALPNSSRGNELVRICILQSQPVSAGFDRGPRALQLSLSLRSSAPPCAGRCGRPARRQTGRCTARGRRSMDPSRPCRCPAPLTRPVAAGRAPCVCAACACACAAQRQCGKATRQHTMADASPQPPEYTPYEGATRLGSNPHAATERTEHDDEADANVDLGLGRHTVVAHRHVIPQRRPSDHVEHDDSQRHKQPWRPVCARGDFAWRDVLIGSDVHSMAVPHIFVIVRR